SSRRFGLLSKSRRNTRSRKNTRDRKAERAESTSTTGTGKESLSRAKQRFQSSLLQLQDTFYQAQHDHYKSILGLFVSVVILVVYSLVHVLEQMIQQMCFIIVLFQGNVVSLILTTRWANFKRVLFKKRGLRTLFQQYLADGKDRCHSYLQLLLSVCMCIPQIITEFQELNSFSFVRSAMTGIVSCVLWDVGVDLIKHAMMMKHTGSVKDVYKGFRSVLKDDFVTLSNHIKDEIQGNGSHFVFNISLRYGIPFTVYVCLIIVIVVPTLTSGAAWVVICTGLVVLGAFALLRPLFYISKKGLSIDAQQAKKKVKDTDRYDI
ncbi:Tapt1 family like protein, partial [Aduncisulcus paluster]